MAGPARGKVVVDIQECKGCGLCVESCPSKCLEFSPELSHYGVHAARYGGYDCTGCGIGFYGCPEPGAPEVYRLPRSLQFRCRQEVNMRQLCKGNVAVISRWVPALIANRWLWSRILLCISNCDLNHKFA